MSERQWKEKGDVSPTFMRAFCNCLIGGEFHDLAGLIKLSLTENDGIPGE